MNQVFAFAGVAVLASGIFVQAADFKLDGQTFSLPDGFVIERVAGPGLVDRPIEADFDEQGRLYVTDSSGSNDPVKKQLAEKPHHIVRLEDSDGDGVFDKSVVYADKLMFPEGAMWHDGSLYLSAPPVIWKLTDTDGDGTADKREEWFDAKTLTGCANDLHGPYMGLDGFIYWCKGAFAEQTYETPGGKPFQTRAAHIFRRRPEGGFIEPVMTGGMDNPVEVAFTPEGERIFTTTFLQNPGGGRRDGLIHAIYGGVYGKVHDVIEGHQRTGDLMPVLAHLGAAAPCGLARYDGQAFGSEYRDNLFACLFNMHKVTRHVLEPNGATYTSKTSDFLVSDSTDFHPTDVIEDADGSLLIINTGGWYKLCCPTSQLWKPDVLGAIYRVRPATLRRQIDPRGLKLNWNLKEIDKGTLAQRLTDARPAVVKRAIAELRRASAAESVLGDVLRASRSSQVQRAAIWALTGRQDGKPSPLVRAALDHSDPSIRHTALQSISVMRDKAAASAVERLLRDSDAQVRRAAAEALGRIGNAGSVKALLNAASDLKSSPNSSLPERVAEHSIIYALIEIDAPEQTRTGLRGQNQFVQRAALIALDQMDGGALSAGDVVPLMDSSDAVLNETANWIVAHRPEWGGALAASFEARLGGAASNAAGSRQLESQLAGLASAEAIQGLLAKTAGDEEASGTARSLALRAMSRAEVSETPRSWSGPVIHILRHGPDDLIPAALQTVASFHYKTAPSEYSEALLGIGARQDLPAVERLEALSLLPAHTPLNSVLFNVTRSSLASENPLPIRTKAAGILARARLDGDQLVRLADDLRMAGPLEAPRLLPAFESAPSERVGRTLISALKNSRGLAGMQSVRIRETFAKYPQGIRDEAEKLCATVNEDEPKQMAHLNELLPKIQNGDIRRGQAIFNSAKASCVSCHEMGYLGGHVGPDLTRIGQVRTDRDLLEAIVYPSASFVRSYEPLIVTTKSGDEYSGVVRKDSADEIVLATGPGAEVRVARADIQETRPGKTSVMPQGFGEQLSTQELGDLIAFLRAAR